MQKRSTALLASAALVAGVASVITVATLSGPAGAVTTAGSYTSVTPTRLLDTRTTHSVAAGATLNLKVEGAGPIPSSGVGSVALNVTVTSPATGGYITVFATGATRPTASNLNFAPGQTVPNLVVARIGTGGDVSFYNGSGGSVQLLADASGWFASGAGTADGTYNALSTPVRLLDTRKGTGGTILTAGTNLTLPVDGHGGVPASGVASVVMNLTATGGTASSGNVTAWGDGTKPTVSNLNFLKGQTIANLAVVPVSSGGAVNFAVSGGAVQLIGDVTGYFLSGGTDPGAFVPLTPTRLLDTRSSTAVAAGATKALTVLGAGGVPGSAVSAVILNVTVTQPAGPGYLTVYGAGSTRPKVSNLNFVKNQTVPNLVIAPVGTGGVVDFFNGSGGTVQVVADVAGYIVGSSSGGGGTTGTISGTITAATGGAALEGVAVDVYAIDAPNESPTLYSGTTAANGTYSISGVTAASAAYAVCFDGRPATGGSSTTGYLSACAGPVAFNTWDVPVGTIAESVTAGGTTTVSLTLGTAGAISGTVTDGTGGAGLSNVLIDVFGEDGTYYDGATTAADGTYRVNAVPAGFGPFVVCFEAGVVVGGGSANGYQDQCYQNINWGDSDLPTGTTTKSVTNGSVTTGVSTALPRLP